MYTMPLKQAIRFINNNTSIHHYNLSRTFLIFECGKICALAFLIYTFLISQLGILGAINLKIHYKQNKTIIIKVYN